jgi:hypothetical protein
MQARQIARALPDVKDLQSVLWYLVDEGLARHRNFPKSGGEPDDYFELSEKGKLYWQKRFSRFFHKWLPTVLAAFAALASIVAHIVFSVAVYIHAV